MTIRRAPKADRTGPDGVVFDSKAEMKRYAELKLLERAGEITDLRRQVKFPLVIDGRPVLIRSDGFPNGRACSYKADFAYREITNADAWPIQETIEDYKGTSGEASRLRIAVVEAIYGIRIKITGAAALRPRRTKASWRPKV